MGAPKQRSVQTCHRNPHQKTHAALGLNGFQPFGGNDTYSSKKDRPPNQARTTLVKKRLQRFKNAVQFAYRQNLPLVCCVTISWDALVQTGEHKEGHCLWRSSWEREHYLRKELRRLCRTNGRPFACIWGRDIGKRQGEHVHLAMFWPSRELATMVSLLDRITGSPASFVREPYSADPVARSTCGGWQINQNHRDLEGALDFAEYIAMQDVKHMHVPKLERKRFGISQAINSKAQFAG